MLEVTPVRPALRTLVIAVLMTAIGAVVSSSANHNHEEGFDFNDGHGINFDENRTGNGSSDTEGDLTASISHSTSTGKTGVGVRADQQAPPGVASLLLTGVTALPNTGGATTGSNVTVTVAP